MSIIVTEGLNLLLLWIELCIFLILSGSFFPQRADGVRRALLNAGLLAAEYAVTQFCGSVILRQVILILIFTGAILLLFRCRLITGFFTVILFFAIINLSDIAAIYGLSMMTGASMASLYSTPEIYCMLAYTAKLVELLIAIIFRGCINRRFSDVRHSIAAFARFTVFPVASLVSAILMYLSTWRNSEPAGYLLFCVVLLLLSNLAAVWLMMHYEKQQQTISEQNMLQRELDAAKGNITDAIHSYEKERKKTHDFRNQLIAIQGMVENQADREEILNYIRQISRETSGHTLSAETHRAAVDAILNQKYESAERSGIRFRVRLDDLSAFPLPDNALVVLLSNLIDNAIEACERISPTEEREILVKMSVLAEEAMLSVENTVSEKVKIINNSVPTTKPDPRHHGYGLKNVAAIVENYEGYYTIQCDDRVFRFAAIFPGPQAVRM